MEKSVEVRKEAVGGGGSQAASMNRFMRKTYGLMLTTIPTAKAMTLQTSMMTAARDPAVYALVMICALTLVIMLMIQCGTQWMQQRPATKRRPSPPPLPTPVPKPEYPPSHAERAKIKAAARKELRMRRREERALLKQEQLEQERLRLEQERLQERLKQERLDARKAKVESALADKLPAALCLVLMEYTEDAWFSDEQQQPATLTVERDFSDTSSDWEGPPPELDSDYSAVTDDEDSC
jgi:hypothetical protein